MQKLQRRLSPSLVISLIALFVALSGTAIAAADKIIVKKPEQMADGVVTAPKLADDAVTNRSLSNVSVGLDELQDPVVAAGVNANGADPFFINPTTENVEVERLGNAIRVTFDRPVRHCQWTATRALILGEDLPGGFMFSIQPAKFDPRTVDLEATRIIGGEEVDTVASFYLVGRC